MSYYPWDAQTYNSFQTDITSAKTPQHGTDNKFLQNQVVSGLSSLSSLGIELSGMDSLWENYKQARASSWQMAKGQFQPGRIYTKTEQMDILKNVPSDNWDFNKQTLQKIYDTASAYNVGQLNSKLQTMSEATIDLTEPKFKALLQERWDTTVSPQLASLTSSYYKNKSTLEMGLNDLWAGSYQKYGTKGFNSDQAKYESGFLASESSKYVTQMVQNQKAFLGTIQDKFSDLLPVNPNKPVDSEVSRYTQAVIPGTYSKLSGLSPNNVFTLDLETGTYTQAGSNTSRVARFLTPTEKGSAIDREYSRLKTIRDERIWSEKQKYDAIQEQYNSFNNLARSWVNNKISSLSF
jgi:hypothetical protein